jgi:hypothetical protein
MRRAITMCVFMLVCVPRGGLAQEMALISAGIGVTSVTANRNTSLERAVPVFRLPRPKGLSVDWDVGADSARASDGIDFHHWHFLFGPAWDIRKGRVEFVSSATVGPSINRVTSPGIGGRNSWAVEPSTTAWIDINHWFGAKLSAGYYVTRFDIDPGGSVASRTVRLQTAVLVRVF